MPYKSEKIKLPKELDRRVKLTDQQREEIKELYGTGCYSLNGLAKQYGVSKKTVLLTSIRKVTFKVINKNLK